VRYKVEDQACVICGEPGRPEGQRFKFCTKCEADWMQSLEHLRAATARQDFANRRRQELENGST
jgi:hypothetical protein